MNVTIGIDEVGRGPVAGPVAVGACMLLSDDFHLYIRDFPVPLRDSKKLSKTQREAWYEKIHSLQQEGRCDFVVSMIPASEIDIYGISSSIKKALAECLDSLDCAYDTLILLDGSLRAPMQFINQITIIKGDEKEMAISLASIVAKVTRDRHMEKLAERYPLYGFEQHVGYGTEAHYKAIKNHGLTPIHRKSFLKNFPEVRRDRKSHSKLRQKRKTRR